MADLSFQFGLVPCNSENKAGVVTRASLPALPDVAWPSPKCIGSHLRARTRFHYRSFFHRSVQRRSFRGGERGG